MGGDNRSSVMIMLPLLTSLVAVNVIQAKTLLVETENKTVADAARGKNIWKDLIRGFGDGNDYGRGWGRGSGRCCGWGDCKGLPLCYRCDRPGRKCRCTINCSLGRDPDFLG